MLIMVSLPMEYFEIVTVLSATDLHSIKTVKFLSVYSTILMFDGLFGKYLLLSSNSLVLFGLSL